MIPGSDNKIHTHNIQLQKNNKLVLLYQKLGIAGFSLLECCVDHDFYSYGNACSISTKGDDFSLISFEMVLQWPTILLTVQLHAKNRTLYLG